MTRYARYLQYVPVPNRYVVPQVLNRTAKVAYLRYDRTTIVPVRYERTRFFLLVALPPPACDGSQEVPQTTSAYLSAIIKDSAGRAEIYRNEVQVAACRRREATMVAEAEKASREDAEHNRLSLMTPSQRAAVADAVREDAAEERSRLAVAAQGLGAAWNRVRISNASETRC